MNWTAPLTPFLYNRGYTGEPTGFPENPPRRIVAHSFGLHWIPERFFSEIDVLVIVSGFVELKARAAMRAMGTGLKTDPHKVLREFHKACGLPQQEAAQIDAALLAEDLERLSTSVFDPALLASVPHCIVLHGNEDAIVSIDASLKIPTHHRHCVAHAGHALPYTHPELCQWLIEQTLSP